MICAMVWEDLSAWLFTKTPNKACLQFHTLLSYLQPKT